MKTTVNEMLMLYGLTPSHVGCEASTDVIDSPVQREIHTGWPIIPASGFKGAMRHAFEMAKDEADAKAIFGSDEGGSGYAGAINFTDV